MTILRSCILVRKSEVVLWRQRSAVYLSLSHVILPADSTALSTDDREFTAVYQGRRKLSVCLFVCFSCRPNECSSLIMDNQGTVIHWLANKINFLILKDVQNQTDFLVSNYWMSVSCWISDDRFSSKQIRIHTFLLLYF